MVSVQGAVAIVIGPSFPLDAPTFGNYHSVIVPESVLILEVGWQSSEPYRLISPHWLSMPS